MSALLRLRPSWLRQPLAATRQPVIRLVSSRPAARAQYNLPVSWRLLESSRVAEFDIDAVVVEHCRTKAQYLHMATSDTNNVFSVNFRHVHVVLENNFINMHPSFTAVLRSRDNVSGS